MRVLHVYRTAFPDTVGGVEKVIDQIARGTSRLGVANDVLSLTPTRAAAPLQINGYTSHRAHLDLQIASTGLSISAFPLFAQLSRAADLIHYHFPWPFMDVLHVAAQVRKPTVATYHSDIIRQKYLLKLYRPLREHFLGDLDRIVATSPNYFATSDVLAKYRDKVRVIPIGMDKADYPEPPAQKIDEWRSRLGAKYFVFVGLLRYYKGLHILLEAARGTDYPIAIAGAGPIERELKQKAAALGLANIYFLGHLPEEDKVALLQASYGVVFPSHLRSEAFGVSLLEGAMYGKPLVSSEIGTGTTFVNNHGDTGLVVPPGDATAMRAALQWLWEHPREAAAMGERAQARYQSHFTGERMARSYVELYRELLPGSPTNWTASSTPDH